VTGNNCVLEKPQTTAKGTSRLPFLLVVFVAVLSLRLTPTPVHFSSEPEPQRALLSSYLVDTEFLAHCASLHEALISRSEVLAPEIRFAVLRLAANQQ